MAAVSEVETALWALRQAYTELTLRVPSPADVLRMSLRTDDLGSVELAELTISPSELRTGGYPGYTVCLPVRGRIAATAHDTSAVVRGRPGLVVSPGSRVHINYLRQDCAVRTVSFDERVVRAELSEMLGRPVRTAPRFEFALRAGSGRGAFQQALALLTADLERPDNLASERAMAARLGRLVVAGLLLAQPHDHRGAAAARGFPGSESHPRGPRRHPRAARRVRVGDRVGEDRRAERAGAGGRVPPACRLVADGLPAAGADGPGAERVAAVLGPARLAIGVVGGFGASVPEPGLVHHNGMEMIRFGSFEALPRPDLEASVDIWRSSGFTVRLFDDTDQMVWEKFVMNVAFSGTCCATGLTIGEVLADPDAWAVARSCAEEAVAVARAAGIRLDVGEPIAHVRDLGSKIPNARPSMLLDFDLKRRGEVDAIIGQVAVLGEKYGVDTPTTRTLAGIIRARETGYV